MKSSFWNRLSLVAAALLLMNRGVGSGVPTLHAEPTASPLAPMPESVTSFAAVTHDGWLYVCGGHRGERHDYTVDQVSGSFHRLNLKDGSAWERLPSTEPGQGMPLVAHGRHLYRTGGMAARNRSGEKQDLVSSDSVLRFDTISKRWESLPSLPEPRSSHDAVVLGDRLYVGGGWQLSGGTNAPVWPAHAWVMDLRHPEQGWAKFDQPFRRRALAMAVHGARIAFIGGMDSDGKPTRAVELLDPGQQTWSRGPDLPEGRFKGFACSAISQRGQAYANAFQGDLLRLADDGSAWTTVGRVSHPRMAHRLVTAGNNQLIVLGGEDGESKRPDLEVFNLNTHIETTQP
jgi:N-acetylneuraminic acid mutarotase